MVTGTVCLALSDNLSAIILRRPLTGMRCPETSLLGEAKVAACRTSRSRIRPPRPLPATCTSSILRRLAVRLARGVATRAASESFPPITGICCRADAAVTSTSVIRPPDPVPSTIDKSTFSWRASLRTDGGAVETNSFSRGDGSPGAVTIIVESRGDSPGVNK